MSANESGEKRTATEQETSNSPITEPDTKKLKLNSDEVVVSSLPILSDKLVLDKVQEDTINQLVQSSNTIGPSTLNVEPKVESQDTNKIMEQEMVSADIEKPVADPAEETIISAPAPATTATKPVEQEKPSASDDLNITSEQLLFALTSSIPPIEAPISGTAATASTSEPVVSDPLKENGPVISQEPIEPTTTAYTAIPMEIDEPGDEDKSIIAKELLAPAAPAPINALQVAASLSAPPAPPVPEVKVRSPSLPITTNGLGITSNNSTAPQPPTALSQPSTSNSTTSNNASSIPPPQLKTNGSNTSNNSPSLTSALTNLPDISAALRRLSSHTVPGSVIEQLSSSPRLPNIGHLNNNERRSSMADVSPSEILGNALAAVAANAAAASRSSPKQPQQPTSSQQQQQTNAATAIGNLAAITANISNLLHSGGFHRNSFNQEDTQKLAAAVAVARNGVQQSQSQQESQTQLQRRKSSMAAFSNMIDQAMLMNRKSIDKSSYPAAAAAQAQQQAPPATAPAPAPAPAPVPVPPKRPKLIIKNEQVWKSLEGVEEKNLGYHLYSPELLLPNLEENGLNGVMEIRVPARYLTFENTRVRKRAVWGTDIYTDDSDVVAMAIHSGKYSPKYIEPDIDAQDPLSLAVAGNHGESIKAARRLAVSGKQWIKHDHQSIPDYDLKITVRVLPTLKKYASSIRNRIKSREWDKHDGMSLFVLKAEKIKRGEARLKGRASIKSSMFAYEPYRKEALGLSSSQQQKISSSTTSTTTVTEEQTTIPATTEASTLSSPSSSNSHRGRVKKSPRVMRMFQIRSEMMNKKV